MQPRCLRGLPKPERSEGSFFSAHLTMEKLACRGYSEEVPNRDLRLASGCFWPLSACRGTAERF
ncbi:hypothetical protein D3C71_1242380 [compost metagenome]